MLIVFFLFETQFKLWLLLTTTALILINFMNLYTLYTPTFRVDTFTKQKKYKVVLLNVNSRNTNQEKVVEYLINSSSEFIVLLEVSSSWKESLEKISAVYPFIKAIPLESNFGIAILSKFPSKNFKVYLDRENMIPILQNTFSLNEQSITISAIHPFPPIGSYATLIRDQYITGAASAVKKIRNASLVCGDFNTSPWTYPVRKFLSKTRHRNNYRLLSLWTWPSFFPLLALDQCYGKGVTITHQNTGPKIGSDHLPLEIDFIFNE